MKNLFLSLIAVCCGWLPSSVAADDFSALDAERVGRAVVMKLPDGVRRVRLRVNDAGEWKTHLIAHLEGSEGYLKLRLPDDVGADDLEIAASWTDPHPYRFYQGPSEFEGETADNSYNRSTPESTTDFTAGPTEETPTVEESDIWKWNGSTLYFFNQYRGLQVIDAADPAAPRLIDSLRVAASGEQMYLLADGSHSLLLAHDSSTGGGQVMVVRHDSDGLSLSQSIPVSGSIIESRMVGRLLYVVSRHSWQTKVIDDEGISHVTWRSGIEITRIDFSDPEKPSIDEPLRLTDEGVYSYWGAQVQATPQALMLATNRYDSTRRQSVSSVHVVDISDPTQPLKVRCRVETAGQVMNKFNLQLKDDVLTVVSQVWRGTDRQRYASVENFSIAKLEADVRGARLGSLEFANNETITATRFVGDRVYVVTVLRVDPLFVVSLADAERPKLLGELTIPGFSTYLQPYGDDALISVGVEDSRIAVSWFDVADPAEPKMASRVYIGAEDGWSWSEANYDEKALGFFPNEQFLLVPYQGSNGDGTWSGGMQLIEFDDGTLTKRGNFTHEFQARRGRVLDDSVISVSGRTLKSLDITDPDAPKLLAELALAWPVDRVERFGKNLVQLENGQQGWYGPSGSDAHGQLHISPSDNPDQLFASLELGPGQIVGHEAETERDLLWVAMHEAIDPSTTKEGTAAGFFHLLAVDLSDPTAPQVVGRDKWLRPNSTNGWYWGGSGDYQADRLPDGTQVWFPTARGSYWGGYYPMIDVMPMDGAFRGGWYPYYASEEVYTADVQEPTEPEILAAVNLVKSGSWREGTIVLRGHTLYFGQQRNEEIKGEDDSTRWINRHWLGRIDLEAPAKPAPLPLINLPGTLEQVIGARSDEAILITSKDQWLSDPTNSWHREFSLQGLAFDGVEAFLVDEFTLTADNIGPRTFNGRHSLIVKNSYLGEESSASCSVYEWKDAAGFARLPGFKFPDVVNDLTVSDSLILARTNSGLAVSDFSNPAEPEPTTLMLPLTRYWGALTAIRVHERREAYVPMGFYGVEVLSLGDQFPLPAKPLAEDRPSFGNAPEWQPVAITALELEKAGEKQLLDPLDDSESWRFALEVPKLGYEAWARLRFETAAGVPVPEFDDDSDGDGASNGWEFLTGSDPMTAGARVQPRSLIAGDPAARSLFVHLPRDPAAAVDRTIEIEWSTDLKNWHPAEEEGDYRIDPFASDLWLEWLEPVESKSALYLRIDFVK